MNLTKSSKTIYQCLLMPKMIDMNFLLKIIKILNYITFIKIKFIIICIDISLFIMVYNHEEEIPLILELGSEMFLIIIAKKCETNLFC